MLLVFSRSPGKAICISLPRRTAYEGKVAWRGRLVNILSAAMQQGANRSPGQRRRFRPDGAAECSRGWSGAAALRPDAEPVESGETRVLPPLFLFRPGGATEIFRDAESTPVPGDSAAPLGRMMSKHERSHGLRDTASGVAPPAVRPRHACRARAATPRRPVGAKTAVRSQRPFLAQSSHPCGLA
jgi:hypothetical protein